MNEHIKVTTVENKTTRFAASLSISEQREEEIDNIVSECHDATSDYPSAIALISEKIDSANELVYACFHLGAYAERMHSKNRLYQKIFGI